MSDRKETPETVKDGWKNAITTTAIAAAGLGAIPSNAHAGVEQPATGTVKYNRIEVPCPPREVVKPPVARKKHVIPKSPESQLEKIIGKKRAPKMTPNPATKHVQLAKPKAPDKETCYIDRPEFVVPEAPLPMQSLIPIPNVPNCDETHIVTDEYGRVERPVHEECGPYDNIYSQRPPRSGDIITPSLPHNNVPEPGTLPLVGLGLAAAGWAARQKAKKVAQEGEQPQL